MSEAKKFLSELKKRGLFFDCTSEEKLLKHLENKSSVYFGIDPTAPSLHLGHYLSLTLLERFIRFGIKVFLLIGDITALIGDPSGKEEERRMIELKEVEKNKNLIKAQIEAYFLKKFTFSEIKKYLEILNNSVFYEKIGMLEFIREIGRFVNVSSLLNKKFLEGRINKGLSFTELSYPIFQSYDFYHLNKNYQVFIQLGGQDQWGNITSGIELIRKIEEKESEVVGLTFPLLLDENQKKFGKSEKNALFLDQTLTKPYDLFQYLINLSDSSSEKYLCSLTFLSFEEIDQLLKKHAQAKEERLIQKKLGEVILSNIYDPEKAKKILTISEKLFGKKPLSYQECLEIDGSIPTLKIEKSFQKIQEILKKIGFSNSNSDSKRLLESNSIYFLNSEKGTFENLKEDFSFQENLNLSLGNKKNSYFLIRKGKKEYGLLKVDL